MKNRIPVRWLFIFLALLASCAGGGYTNFGDAPPPPEKPIRDYLVVPGHRIGPVSIGMTAKQLLEAMGEPDRVQRYKAGDGRLMQSFMFGPFEIHMPALDPQKITSVRTTDSRYATAQGLRVGSSTLSFSSAFGAPTLLRGPDDWCYAPGLEALFDGAGKATALIVQTPGC